MSKRLLSAFFILSFLNTVVGVADARNTFDFADQKSVDVSQVSTAIRAFGAPWRAKENWVSRLTVAQVKRMLGARNVPDANLQFKASESVESRATNSALDWRSVNGVNWVTPVLNQGNCGSCVAFATAGTLETQMQISAKLPTLNPRLSTQALFACGGGSCDMGWEPSDAQAFLAQEGIPDSACLPYSSGATGQDVDCSAACSDRARRSIKTVPTAAKVAALGSIDTVKRALAHGPVETTLTVYADFLTYSSGVYRHLTGDALGGHAVSIVGYDDAQRAWIIRNSWGNDWGNQGFMLVSYDDTSGVAQEIWSFDLPSEQGYLSFASPSDRQILSGIADLKIVSSVDANSSLSYTILDSKGKNVFQNSAHGIPPNLTLDTTKLQDGQYEIFAKAVTPTNVTVDSLHVEFYVLNSKPTGTLTFQPQFDITKPLTDRVVFNVAAAATPVPYTNLTLHVQQAGQDVYSKSIDTVLPSMTFGWRTNTTPNGRYDIFMTADLVANGSDTLHVESPHASVTTVN